MYKIDKQFHFEYGHRVWSQTLHKSFCEDGNDTCACKHLHGHSGKVHVYAESESLRDGMVTDFKHLGWMKNFLDDNLDHKFILDINDPQFARILNASPVLGPMTGQLVRLLTPDNKQITVAPIRVTSGESSGIHGWKVVTAEMEPEETEFYGGFFFVDFVPTAEHFCKWLHTLANEKMALMNVKISQVDWCETAKSRSSYTN